MRKEEFIRHAENALSYEALEPLFETISQHNGEVAQFGDSWPGALIQIQGEIKNVRNMERQLARLQKRPERDFRFCVRNPT